MAKILTNQKLHVWTWMITLAILWGTYTALAIIMEINKVNTLYFNNTIYNLLASFYVGITPTTKGVFLGLGYGILDGAICGGLFAVTHNLVRNLFKK